MQRWTQRPYAGSADLARLLEALSLAHCRRESTSLMHPGDLVWALFQNTVVDPCEVIQLWEREDSTVAGFALLEDEDLELQVLAEDPQERAALQAEALELAQRRRGFGQQLRTEALASAQSWRALLEARGFTPDLTRRTRRGEPYTGMVRFDLALGDGGSVPPGAPRPPGGRFTVRAVGGEQEWPARVELHRRVWAPSRVTLEAYRRLRGAPLYRPDLDLVAVDGDGTLLSYAIVWFDQASQVGEFEPVGTHPDHRRQGAAAAVLGEGLRRLRDLGADRALVTSSADNAASLRLYESVGFRRRDAGTFYHLAPARERDEVRQGGPSTR